MKDSVPRGRMVLFWAIALGGAAFDLTTKAIAFHRIGEPGQNGPVSVIADVLELRTSYNTGALWGFGKDWPYSSQVFAALSVVAAVAICYWLFVKGAAVEARLTAALALIMAGALGNCYDRLALGHVRDFVHWHVDPIGFDCAIFNFADNMLVIGAVSLMLLAMRPEPEPQPAPPTDAAAAESTAAETASA